MTVSLTSWLDGGEVREPNRRALSKLGGWRKFWKKPEKPGRVILASRPPLFASHYRTQRSPDIRKSKIDHPSENPKFPIEKILSQKNNIFLLHFWGPHKNRFLAEFFLILWKKFKKAKFCPEVAGSTSGVWKKFKKAQQNQKKHSIYPSIFPSSKVRKKNHFFFFAK